MPETVEPPREEPIASGKPLMRCPHALVVLLWRRCCREGPAGHHPGFRGDHLGGQRAGAEQRVKVLVDQTRNDHVVCERVINGVRGVVQRSNDVVERADSHNAPIGDSDRLGSRPVGIHRDHRLGEMNNDFAGFGHARKVDRPLRPAQSHPDGVFHLARRALVVGSVERAISQVPDQELSRLPS